ncbi:coproporphyrinogen-III oxidase family protein [Pseudoalteromonas luteoviolacea]|uniref:coproporphyrinogen-III oxidase family protein n=1 Tax=Pseudoalteromonas luteoviolacea TaxID=43657 RepID=UPI001B366818|nr:coproporphyrinogen-III oxidase family protein [Pseudoalteromonas luteoviolacea]MBQ4838760.1 coproporphyrinogen III oxidase family protein [Pseudoalteromonas luteoviolacea]
MEIKNDDAQLPVSDLNRKGFITTYPPSRYWKGTFHSEALEDNRLNLYIHIPFCIQRCRYCFFKIIELSESNQQDIDNYVDYLCKEIALVSKQYAWSKRPVDTLYFGGGTPSLLKARHLSQIMDTLNAHYTMALSEFVFEVEPITYNKKKSEELAQFGITRLSFGIQSFSDEVVTKTGRKDTETMNIDAIQRALDTGVIVNIDLLSGLEGETEQSWRYSIDRAIALNVHSITVYKMELYQNSKYFSDLHKNSIILPTDDQEMAFMDYAIEQLHTNNYQNSTFFTFTKNGDYPQKHLHQRWQGEDTYGFGVSAFSSLQREYIQNTSRQEKYKAAIDQDILPVERGVKLTSMDLIARDIVLGMKTARLDCKWLKAKHGIDLLSSNNLMLKKLIEQNFIAVQESTIKMTNKGVFYGDFVGKALSRHFLDSFA